MQQESSSPAPTLSKQQLAQVDLSEALLTLEDLPAGSQTLIENEDTSQAPFRGSSSAAKTFDENSTP